METTVLKALLKEGLEIANRIAVRSTQLPILSNVLLSVEKEKVQLSATDLQIGVVYRFLGTTRAGGAVVFPGHPLSALLSISSGEQVSLLSKDRRLSVTTGEHRATLQALDAEEFPIIPSPQESELLTEIDTATVCRALSQVVGMTGQSQARPEISGVLFTVMGKTASAAATDSFRLAERRFSLEKETGREQSFILPAKTVRELITILGERPGRAELYLSPAQVAFVYEAKENPSRLRIQIVSRLIEGEYPRYQEVTPASHKTLVSLGKNEFLNHLRATGIFAGKAQEVRLLADPRKKAIEFFSENKEAGSHRSALRAEVEGDSVEVAFNWRFLMEGLVQMRGERVEFALNGEDGAALLRPSEQEGYLYVLMPIKA